MWTFIWKVIVVRLAIISQILTPLYSQYKSINYSTKTIIHMVYDYRSRITAISISLPNKKYIKKHVLLRKWKTTMRESRRKNDGDVLVYYSMQSGGSSSSILKNVSANLFPFLPTISFLYKRFFLNLRERRFTELIKNKSYLQLLLLFLPCIPLFWDLQLWLFYIHDVNFWSKQKRNELRFGDFTSVYLCVHQWCDRYPSI